MPKNIKTKEIFALPLYVCIEAYLKRLCIWLKALMFSRRQAAWGTLNLTSEVEAPKSVITFKMWSVLKNNRKLSRVDCTSMNQEMGALGS